MKTKKVLLGLAFTAVILGVCSCKNNTEVVLPEVTKVIGIENGATDVDPTQVSVIDVRFSKAMDRNYSTFWRFDDTADEIYYAGWVNDYTYRFEVFLTYDTSYSFSFCEEGPDVNKEALYLRDTEGNYLKRYSIQFSTIKSPTTHPHNYVLKLSEDLKEEYAVKLQDNSEYNPNTQQAVVNLKYYLNHDKVKKGDTVEIPYKIKSNYDLHNIKVNLVDTSSAANYWKLLTATTTHDLVLVDELKASTPEQDYYKEGTLKFTIDDDMIIRFGLQICADYGENFDNKDLVNIIYVPIPANTAQ